MARIEGLQQLVAQLRDRAARAVRDSNVSVSVSYATNYAIFVHENLEAKHPVGQAKFLEQPARELSNSGEMSRIVSQAIRARKTMAQALVLAGLRLQRESQVLCPVDTGNLRATAQTTLEGGT